MRDDSCTSLLGTICDVYICTSMYVRTTSTRKWTLQDNACYTSECKTQFYETCTRELNTTMRV